MALPCRAGRFIMTTTPLVDLSAVSNPSNTKKESKLQCPSETGALTRQSTVSVVKLDYDF